MERSLLARGGLDNVWKAEADDEIDDVVQNGAKPKRITVDDIIARRKTAAASSKVKKRKREAEDEGDSERDQEPGTEESEDYEDESSESESNDEGFGLGAEDEKGSDDGNGPLSDEDSGESVSEGGQEGNGEDVEVSGGSSSDESEEETQVQKARKAAYFAPEEPEAAGATTGQSFLSMNLSRPILRAIQAANFTEPTPIQKKAIPVGLQGLDVLGSAVTGSGKTAAFMVPILERLMYKDKTGNAEIRVLVLTPTRELAAQCAEVGKQLAKFIDVTFALIVGGLPLKTQEATLRARPDIVIATPGRLIDHLHNAPSFNLSAIDILVLDEADRMLSDGFADELKEIIDACPKSRQTMLFSATMTDDVDSLVRLSMNRPVRLFVDPKKTVARALTQEFVRVRKEDDRMAILAAICKRTARNRAIVFFRSKLLCHQMKVVFGLLGWRAAELHGNLKQEVRLDSLRQFREGEVDYLLCTDVASRGLDIKGVETVINYDMPNQIELYLHRVGRTARASSKGRSISLVGEPDRKMLKAVIKRSDADKVKHRVIPPDSLKTISEQLKTLKPEVAEVLQEEQEEKAIQAGEMKLSKMQNLAEHKDEILSRPRREWFQSSQEKKGNQALSREQYEAQFDGVGTSAEQAALKLKRKNFSETTHKARRRKEALEDGSSAAVKDPNAYVVRQLKKAARPVKIGVKRQKVDLPSVKMKKQGGSGLLKVKKVGFDKELGVRGSGPASREGTRSVRGDNVPLRDKKGRGMNGPAGALKGKGTGRKGVAKGKFKGKGRR
ncbi:nucleolar DEAD-box protein required for synthesis of 60S ribosomal subunit [Tulasnella sp. JGI-2019a]|nr:nucleolar DEAD-box protein required for synthesis of 60S ribosomal subunit [Tulasnella sp. JGI-2019a]KAG9039073.1 nucleolar DEAD-box protein required for synthesis of 60S ribosomal subunit [Tulasnella sp. JGI-2019a]